MPDAQSTAERGGAPPVHRLVARRPPLVVACSAWEEALAARLAGDESAAQRQRLDAHLTRRVACTTELRELQAIATALRRLGGAVARRSARDLVSS
jgi:hypothetical protein